MTEQERGVDTIERDTRSGMMNAVRDPTLQAGADDVEQGAEQPNDTIQSVSAPEIEEQGSVESLSPDQEQDNGVVVAQVAEQVEQQAAAEQIANGVSESVETDDVAVAVMHEPGQNGALDVGAQVAVVSEADESDAPAETDDTVVVMDNEELSEVAQESAGETSTTDDAEVAQESAGETSAIDDAAEADGASFVPVEDEAEDARPRRLKDLEVGMELDGRVTSIALYGIFVDIGVGRDGLVHISEMSDTRINSPSDLVQIGDTVKVRVKGIDVEARRISLTMRPPRGSTNGGERSRGRGKRPEVNRELLASLKVGDMVEGKITGLAQFGAFVDIGVGKDGLVHISEMSEGHVDKPEDAVQVGDCHTFKILEVDPEGTRISLSLRRALRIQKMQQLEPGQEIEGTVSGMAPFGAFVDIGVGRDGLVHISQLSENRVGKVEDVVKVGDKVTVRVLEVDPQSKRISLTMRLHDEMPEEEPSPDQEGEALAPSVAPEPRSVPASASSQPREREAKRDRRRSGGRGGRSTESAPQQPETYTTSSDDDDEEFEGNATLEDLLTKFGGNARRDRRRRSEEEEEDERQRNNKQRQRDAIRRTLQHHYEDE